MEVVCGILIWNDKVLIGKRKSDNNYHPGKWEFPGGKVEVGESHWEGIRREFKEELDIVVHPFHQLRTLSDGVINLTPFTLKLVSGKARLIEHDEVKFVGRGEFFKMDLLDLNKKVGRDLFDSYSIFLKKEI